MAANSPIPTAAPIVGHRGQTTSLESTSATTTYHRMTVAGVGLWRSRGAEFLTEPKPKYGETRCYIRDPDGYIIEVGQSNPGVAYG